VDYPEEMFEKRLAHAGRSRACDAGARRRMIRSARRPLIRGRRRRLYSEATEALANFAVQTGIPVGETMGEKDRCRSTSPELAHRVTGTPGANIGRARPTGDRIARG